MNQRSLAQSLAFETLEPLWREYLKEWEGATPEQLAEARCFIASIHEDIFASLQDANDAEERRVLLNTHYIRLKSHWMIFNTQIGYQMAAGRMNELLFMQASLLSSLMAALEAHLEPHVVEFLDRVLSDPVGEADNIGALLSGIYSSGSLASVSDSPEGKPRGGVGDSPGSARRLCEQVQELTNAVSALRSEREAFAIAAGSDRMEDILSAIRRGVGKHANDLVHPAPPQETAFPSLDRLITLSREHALLTAFRDTLLREMNKDTLEEVLQHYRSLCETLAVQNKEIYWQRCAQEMLRQEFGEKTLQEVIAEIRRDMGLRVRLEDEVAQARRERALVARELGCDNPDDILRVARGLHDRIRGFEAEIAQFAADRDYLFRTLGRKSPKDIVAYFRDLNDKLASMAQEVGLSRVDRSLLEMEFGSADVGVVIDRFRQQRAASIAPPGSQPSEAQFNDFEQAMALLQGADTAL